MKAIKSIFLTLIIVFSHSGMAVNVHYCAGQIMDFSISMGEESLECGMESTTGCQDKGSETELHGVSCCVNESMSISVDEKTVADPLQVNPVSVAAVMPAVIASNPIFYCDSSIDTPLVQKQRPPNRSLHLFYCTFLI